MPLMNRTRAVLEELEPRILYSADIAAVTLAVTGSAPVHELKMQTLAQAQVQALAPTHEIAFVDMSVVGADALVDDLLAQRNAGRQIEVVAIDLGKDGIDVITQTLAMRNDITAVHLISHGSDGDVRLGTQELNQQSLMARASEVAGWGASLTAEADILIYGCDVAAGADGQALVANLAALTGADVAASADFTGAASAGGNWLLEVKSGAIEAAVAPSAQEQQDWQGTLVRVGYESFSNGGELVGKTGGTGWATVWSGPVGELQVTGSDLSNESGTLVSGGGSVKAVIAANYATTTVERNLNTVLGAPGTSTWISFVVQPDRTGPFLGDYMGLEFGSAAADVMYAGYYGSSFIVGKAGAAIPTFVSGYSAVSGQKHLIVVQIQHNAGNDAITLYVDPTPGLASPEATHSASTASYDVGTFTRIAIAAGNGAGANSAQLDEIRIGQTYADVTPNVNAPVFTSTTAYSVPENTTTVATLTATDPDTPIASLVYSIVGGADAAKFSINGTTGALRFVTAPDFEAPTDAGSNNVYDVTVRVSDGTSVDTQSIAVTVTPVNDNAPVITSNGGGAAASVNVVENTTVVTTVSATDADLPAQPPVYTIVGGADAAKFGINSSTGVLSFLAAPDFEAPTDTGANNVYDVTVRVSDGSLVDTQAIAVNVLNNPTSDVLLAAQDTYINKNAATIDYGQSGSLVLDRLGGSLGDGRILLQFDLSDIPANATITSATLVMQSTQNGGALDLNIYRLTQPWQEGSGNGVAGAASWNQRLPGTNWASAGGDYDPTVIATLNTGSIGQHSWNVTSLVTNWASSYQPNFGLMLASPTGGSTTVTYDSAEGTVAPRLLVTFNTSNTPPTITSNGGAGAAAVSVAENAAAVTTVIATDVDLPAQSLVYSIVGGADAARFTIDAASGALSFVVPPDYDLPADAGADNVFDVTVRVSDGAGGLDTQDIAVTVTPLNDNAPQITSNGGGANATVFVAENSTAVTTVTATDADLPAQSLSYSIAGGADAALFTIDPASGLLRFVTAPDFEAPVDAGADNVYDVTVRVSDGTFVSTQALAVTVTNVPVDAPRAVGDSATVVTGGSVTIDVAANDSIDLAGAGHVIDVTLPTGGSATLSAGQVVYTAAAPFVGSDSFNYLLADNSQQLAHYWRLDGNADDAVGTANGSLVAQPVNTAGVWGGGVYFDGAAQHASIPDVTYSAEFTLSFWFKLADNSGTGLGMLYGHGALGATNSLNVYFVQSGNTTDGGAANVLRTRLLDGTDADNLGALDIAAGAIADGQWHQYTLTTNSGTGSSVYVDGTLRASSANGGDAIDPMGNVTLAAGAALQPGTFFKGALDSVALYDRGFNAPEVADLHGGGSRVATVSVTVVPTGPTAPVITSDGGGATASISVFEGTTTVTAVQASDSDLPAQTLTYSIVAGADAALFEIDPASGALRFKVAPDFEAPADAGADNVYDVRVQVSDGALVDTQNIAVTVLDTAENVTALPDSYALTEDQPFATNVATGWFDAAWTTRRTLTFDNSAGPALTDQVVLVTLNSATVDYARTQNAGQDLRFVDADGNVLAHEIEVWDEAGVSRVWVRVPYIGAGSTIDSITMYYGNTAAADGQSSAAVWGSDALSVLHLGTVLSDSSVAANTVTTSATAVATGQVGSGRVFDGSTSFVSVGSATAIDDVFVGGGTISAWIRPTGWGEVGFGRIASKATTAFPGGGNGDGWNLELNQAGSNLIFEVGFGTNPGRWTTPVGSITLNVWQQVTVVYDNQSVANAPRIFIDGVQVAVTRTSTPSGAPTSDATMALYVGNQSQAQTRTFAGSIDEFRVYDGMRSAAQIAADYRATATVMVSVSAPQSLIPGVLNNDSATDGPALTAQLVAGPTHAAAFTLNADGTFTYTPNADYAGVDTFTYVARSGAQTSAPTTVSLNIAPVADAPSITFGGGLPTASVASPENQVLVGTMTATDPDLPAVALTWSIIGGADAARFSIDANSGALSFLSAPDYEAPADAGANNIYDVVVQVSDGALTDMQALAISVLPVNDNAPVITSGGGGASAAVSVNENVGTVTTFTANDADLPAPTLIWSIVGGTDAVRFTINSGTGVLSFVTPPDYEVPVDVNASNLYNVVVQVADGGFIDTQALAVTVLPVNDNAPLITSNGGGASATVSVNENGTLATTVTATDADLPSQAIVYSIIGGADAARFTINATSGALSFVTAPDFESPADIGADNVYDVTVAASDGTFSAMQAVAIVILPVNDNAPVITSNGGGATASVAVNENLTTVTTVMAADADLPAQSLVYSIAGGADSARFAINASTGVLRFAAAPDFESPSDQGANNVYEVTVQVSDGGLVALQAISVTVLPVNDNTPVIVGPGGVEAIAVDENTTMVKTFVATDADQPASTLSWSIAGGADALRFAVDAVTGVLTFKIGPDYEAPSDAGNNNVYEVIVQVSDGTFSAAHALAVSVRPVDDNAPVVASNGGASVATISVAENSVAVTTVMGADADLPAQTLTYSITGGADAAALRIDAASGRLEFINAPDYERAADADGDGRYVVVVSVSDGVRSASQTLNIDITNVNEPPVVTVHSMVISDGGVVFTLMAADVDTAPAALRYTVQSSAGGRFERTDARGTLITSFTQADVDAGRIIFAADGSGTEPAYVLQLADGASTVAVTPPTVRREAGHTTTSPSGTGAAPAPTVTAPAAQPSAAAATAPGAAPRAEPVAGNAHSQEAAAATDLSNDTVRGPQFNKLFASIDMRTVRNADGGLGYGGDAAFRLTLPSEEASALQRAGAFANELFSSSGAKSFVEELDRMRRDLSGEQTGEIVAMGTAGALATSMSAGYLLWLARGGVLLASLMSSVPAWAGLDPLPVLSQMRGKPGEDADDEVDGEGADDPIERLFSRARQWVSRPAPPEALAPSAEPGTAKQADAVTMESAT